jgi:hypothetical protein
LELSIVAKPENEFGQVVFGVVARLDLDPAGEPALLVHSDLFQAFQQHALAYAAQTGETDVGGKLRSPAERRSEAAYLVITAGEEQRGDSGTRSIWIARSRTLRHNRNYFRIADPKNQAVI